MLVLLIIVFYAPLLHNVKYALLRTFLILLLKHVIDVCNLAKSVLAVLLVPFVQLIIIFILEVVSLVLHLVFLVVVRMRVIVVKYLLN